MSDALRFDSVSVRYPSSATEVLSDISLQVASGERVALLGLNGSGKTTLLLSAVGLLPFSGRIEVTGRQLSKTTERMLRDQTGFLFGVPDDQLLFPNVLDDVAFSLERRGVPRETARAKARETLTSLGIGERSAHAPHTLSQGQRQRVALAGALVARPPLLLLDEPTASLDPVGREELAAILSTQEAALLVATHDLAFVQGLCRRFVVLREGRVVEDTADPEQAARVYRQKR